MTGNLLRPSPAIWLLALGCFAVSNGMRAQTISVPATPGQTHPQAPPIQVNPAPLTFEVATIKPAAPSPDGHTHINYPPGDRFSASNITLLALLNWAYRIPPRQILDGPAWLGSTRFDLQAKLDPASLPANATGEEDRARRRSMVQSLLADRCGLKLHEETRTLPAYDLVPAKGGPKLQPPSTNGTSIGTGRNHLNGEGLTIPLIAEQLSQFAGRVVVDKTALTGRYDLHLRWRSDDTPSDSPDASLPSFFTAVEEQLGLRLESAKEPVPVLVIDHIDPPSAN